MEYQELEPIRQSLYDHRLESLTGQLADATNKRVGGGRVQLGFMAFDEVADVLIPINNGYDKRDKREYLSKTEALERVLGDGYYSLEKFENAIVIAAIRKYIQDPKDGFIPLAPGTIDIEAGLQPDGPWAHRELKIFGIPKDPDSRFCDSLMSKIGLATEYSNGDSIEIVVPMYTPGIWTEIKDLEFERKTGMFIVTRNYTLWSEGLNINYTYPQWPRCSVKMEEALKIARQVAREIDLR